MIPFCCLCFLSDVSSGRSVDRQAIINTTLDPNDDSSRQVINYYYCDEEDNVDHNTADSRMMVSRILSFSLSLSVFSPDD